MNEFELNLRLKQEMESMAPNRLEELLAACGDAPVKPNIEPIASHRRFRASRFAAAAAAVVLLFAGSFFGLKGAQRSVVTMEVNPSISFTVSGFDRVRGVSLNNADAEALFDADALKGMSLEDAVESVSCVLLNQNILRADANGVLVSVSDVGASGALPPEKAMMQIAAITNTAAITPMIMLVVFLLIVSSSLVPLFEVNLDCNGYLRRTDFHVVKIDRDVQVIAHIQSQFSCFRESDGRF